MRRFCDRDGASRDGEAILGVDEELESLEIEVAWDGSNVDADEVHIFLLMYAFTSANYIFYFSIAVPISSNPIYFAPFSDVADSVGNSCSVCSASSHSHPAAS